MFIPFKQTRPPANKWLLAASLVAAALSVACRSNAAIAADMAMPTKASAAPVYQWSGCYAGINGGGGAGSSDFNATVGPGTYLGAADAATVSQAASGSDNNSFWFGGGQIGCNWQSGTVVVGLEGDYDAFRSTSAFFNDTNAPLLNGNSFVTGQSLKSDYLATIRPRLGIAADRNFAYLTGGVAFSNANYTVSYVDTGPSVGSASASKQLTGWVAGAGWEYALADHWTLRFEYLYAAFPKITATGVITGPGPTSNPISSTANLVLQEARAGLNFKF
jgi:outer membrane immunogenic protein